jgi:hypothetical protein
VQLTSAVSAAKSGKAQQVQVQQDCSSAARCKVIKFTAKCNKVEQSAAAKYSKVQQSAADGSGVLISATNCKTMQAGNVH